MCNIDRYLDELTPIDKDSPWLGFVQSRKTTCGRETGQTDLAKECFCRGLRNATRQSGVRAWIATDEALAAGLGRLSADGTAPGVYYYYYSSSSTFTRRVPRVSCCLQLDGRERKRERERMAGAFAGCTAVVLVGCLLLKERKRGWRPPRCKSVFTFSMRRPPDPHSPLSYPPASSYCSCRFSSEGEGEKSKKEKLEGDATGQNTEKTDGRISKWDEKRPWLFFFWTGPLDGATKWFLFVLLSMARAATVK